MTSAPISYSEQEYTQRLAELDRKLDVFIKIQQVRQESYASNAKRLKECVAKKDEKEFKTLLVLFENTCKVVLEQFILDTDLKADAWVIEHINSDLFVDVWLEINDDSAELIIELADSGYRIPDKLLSKFTLDSIYITPKALSNIVNKVELPLVKKWFEYFSPASKACVIDQMEVPTSELVPKEEVVEVVEELERIRSDKTVRFIAALPLNSFKELVKLRFPISRIVSRCLCVPDLLRLTRMGISKEHFLLYFIIYSEGKPFIDHVRNEYCAAKIKSFPPILLILCLNHQIRIDRLLPSLSNNHRNLYDQIPFIAAFGAHVTVLNMYHTLKHHENPNLVYSLLKSLAIQRRDDEDRLSLEDASVFINKTVKNQLEQLSSYFNQFKSRNVKAFWSYDEIENLEHFLDVIHKATSIHYDARIAPFINFRARPFLTSDIVAVQKLCEEGKKLISKLMQYEDKDYTGVINKGPRGKSQDRHAIMRKDKWKD